MTRGSEGVGDVKMEWVVTAPVLAELVAVEPDEGLEVDRAEVQEHAFLPPLGGEFEGAAVPEPVVLGDVAHDPGEGGFNRERHEDRFGKRVGSRGRARCDGASTDCRYDRPEPAW